MKIIITTDHKKTQELLSKIDETLETIRLYTEIGDANLIKLHKERLDIYITELYDLGLE